MGVKYLCLNTLRTFKNKKLQACAIGSIIFLSAFLYTMMSYSIDSLRMGVELLVEETNQEDFSVVTLDALLPEELMQIPEEKRMTYSTYRLSEIKRIDEVTYQQMIESRKKVFEKIYPNYQLELRSYKDIDYRHSDEGHTLRIFKDAEQINKTYVQEGRLPQTKTEIVLNEAYGEKNNLELGDTITINEMSYTITGWVLFSDMNLLLLGDDFILDNKKIGVGVMYDEQYEKINVQEAFYYAGKDVEGILRDDFKEVVMDSSKEDTRLDFIVDIIPTANQMRSGGIQQELEGGQAATLGLCIFISGIAIMLVGILVGKLLRNERVQIGVLKALGYKTWEITISYIVLLLIIAIPMVGLGYQLGKVAATPLKSFYREFFLLLDYPVHDQWDVFATAVILPVVLIIGLSTYMIMKMLSKPTLQLMKVGEDEKIPKLFIWMSERMRKLSVQTKFKYTFIYKNTGKFMVFFWGIMFSAMLILMSLMMAPFFEKMTIQNYTQVDYIYEGIVDLTKPTQALKEGEEKSLMSPNGFYKDEMVIIHGLESDNQLFKLYDDKGKEITQQLDEGILINQSFAIMYELEVGETLTLEIADKAYSFEVIAITNGYGAETVYMNRAELSKLLSDGKREDLYTSVYATKQLEEDQYLTITNKYDIMEQTELMQGFLEVAIYAMIGSAIFISSIILYVLTTMTIEDNYYNISLLKVMGYNKKEVNSMILNSYLIYAIITYILSIPITQISMDFMVDYFSKAFGMVLPLELTVVHMIIGGILVISIFEIGTIAAKLKIQKVPLQEILKAYRE